MQVNDDFLRVYHFTILTAIVVCTKLTVHMRDGWIACCLTPLNCPPVSLNGVGDVNDTCASNGILLLHWCIWNMIASTGISDRLQLVQALRIAHTHTHRFFMNGIETFCANKIQIHCDSGEIAAPASRAWIWLENEFIMHECEQQS